MAMQEKIAIRRVRPKKSFPDLGGCCNGRASSYMPRCGTQDNTSNGGHSSNGKNIPAALVRHLYIRRKPLITKGLECQRKRRARGIMCRGFGDNHLGDSLFPKPKPTYNSKCSTSMCCMLWQNRNPI